MAWTTPRSWVVAETVTAAILNAHLRDNLLAVDDHETFTSYTPVLTASTSNPTLGSGSSQLGFYIQTGNITHYWFRVAFGTSGTAAGTGNYQISLPVDCSFVIATQAAGAGWIYDSSGTDRYLVSYTTGAATFLLIRYDNGTVAAAAPFAWGASDVISGYVQYRSA